MLKAVKSTAVFAAAISIMALATVFTSHATYATSDDAHCSTGTAADLSVVWNSDTQISISTKSGLPLCQDLNLYYSTYVMPDDYNGHDFSTDNTTSFPQTIAQSTSFTLPEGEAGAWVKDVPAPDYCKNMQADLYYGPEITGIDNSGLGYHADGSSIEYGIGHGDQYINGVIYSRDTDKCAPGMGGGTGETTPPTTPSTPSTPVGGNGGGETTPVTTSTTPTVLPFTGVDLSQNVLSTLITAVFGGSSLMALGLRSLRR